MISPYRAPAARAVTAASRTLSEEVQLLPFYGFVWIASLARVLTACARHEVFATEVTLAAMLVIALPILARKEFVGLRGESRKG